MPTPRPEKAKINHLAAHPTTQQKKKNTKLRNIRNNCGTNHLASRELCPVPSSHILIFNMWALPDEKLSFLKQKKKYTDARNSNMWE